MVAAITTLLTIVLPPLPAMAACTPPPPRSSPEGRLRIRTHPIVVMGFIGGDVPSNAHGAYSLDLTVRKQFAPAGPQTLRSVSITNYADLELHEGFERPGNRTSLRASADLLRRFAGQRAIFFLAPRDNALGKDTTGRYAREFSTNQCLYNVIGEKDVATFLPLLTQIFNQPAPAPGATTLPPPGTQPGVVPTGSLPPAPAGTATDEGRSGPITRAAGLVLVVGAALLFYRSPKSPLFQEWRRK